MTQLTTNQLKLEKDGQVYYLTAKELKDDSKPENGTVTEGTTEITYVYEKAGQVVVHYVDEAGIHFKRMLLIQKTVNQELNTILLIRT